VKIRGAERAAIGGALLFINPALIRGTDFPSMQSILSYAMSGLSFRLAAVSVLLGLVVWAMLGPPKPAVTHVSARPH
jgi:hypothetical protein